MLNEKINTYIWPGYVLSFKRYEDLPWEKIVLKKRKHVNKLINQFLETGSITYYDEFWEEEKTVKPIAISLMQRKLFLVKENDESEGVIKNDPEEEQGIRFSFEKHLSEKAVEAL